MLALTMLEVFQREQGTGNREQEKLMFKNMRLK
jgi:hypothetical protein